MSKLKPQISSSNEDGYLSDGSWCSDFDDSPESSDNFDIPLSEDYSQEIKDNQINENLEAKLANATYVNTPQPLHCVSEVNPHVESATANSSPDILTKNLGAIPKTAFSYLNNELNQNIKKKLVIKESPRHDNHLEEIKPSTSDKPLLNLFINSNNSQKLALYDKNLNKSIKEELQDCRKPNTTSPTQATPSKLKPEAFSFLSRIIENQSSKIVSRENITRDHKKHIIPTPIVDEKSMKQSHASAKYPENDKYECVDPVPTAPTLFNCQINSELSVDRKSSLTHFTNETKLGTTVQKQDKEIIKPPLPARPPPISKYPLGMFSQGLPGISNASKCDKEHFILPCSTLQSSSIKIIPTPSQYSTSIDSGVRVEFEEIRVPTTHVRECSLKRADILSETCVDVGIRDRRLTDGGKKSTTLIGNSLSNIKNIDMSERPLPPVPTSRDLKMTQNDIQTVSTIKQIGNEEVKTETDDQINPVPSIKFSTGFLKQNLLSNSAAEGTVPTLQNTNSEEQTPQKRCAPDLKPKLRQRLDIIGHQTNVSSATFHSQHKISVALTARLQNQSSMKSMNDSYEKPNNESAPPDFIEQEGCARSVRLNMDPKKPDIISREENDPSLKGCSPVRNFSDIDELQQAITRPCLPQKLRTTQRSVSCTSLVQTFKDMSFSIWNNDKDKRRSEGRSSFESPAKTPNKDNKAGTQATSIVSSKEETIPKVTLRCEEKVDVKPIPEKTMMSRFPWYHQISAREAQHRLLALGQDGTFLIRPSSTPTADIQFTTCVVYCRRVLNLHIRQKQNGQYALGKEKYGEKTFSSLSDLIKYHQEIPIEIRSASRASTTPELIYVYLRVTPPK